MANSRDTSLPLTARAFVATVSVCGLALAAWSARSLVQSTLPPEWTLFAILTIASGMLTLKVPSSEARFSVSEAFGFASVLLFGPAVGVLTFALDGLRISFRWKMNAQQTVFNFSNLALSIGGAGWLFFVTSGMTPLYQHGAPSPAIVLHVALMTAVYFGLNSGLTAIVVGLSTRRSTRAVWREHYWPLFPSYVAGGSVALLLVLAFREVQFSAIALIVPLLLICYLTLRSSFGRLEDAKNHVQELNRLLFSTVETLATAIDAKDEVTHDHVRRVQQGTLALARTIGISDQTMLQAIEAAALLHDTGKIAIPEHILNKPGKLTPAEFEKMKRHAPIGAEILSSIEFPFPVVPIVRHHHENWDGTGYPDGLKGEAIPLGARILQVVDCFDALTSDRPYRRRLSDEQSLTILRERRGSMYDPAIVDAFIADYKRIMPETSPTVHPASRAIGDARAQDREDHTHEPVTPGAAVTDGLLAVSSLSRALAGEALVADVGALLWTILRPVIACDTMAVFIPDVARDEIAMRFSAGLHASAMRGMTIAAGSGVVGWVAVNTRFAVNADPALDLGSRSRDLSPALRSCLVLPLVTGDALVAVLALYRTERESFSEDDVRMAELLAPRLAVSLDAAVETEDAVAVPASIGAPGLKLVKSGATR